MVFVLTLWFSTMVFNYWLWQDGSMKSNSHRILRPVRKEFQGHKSRLYHQLPILSNKSHIIANMTLENVLPVFFLMYFCQFQSLHCQDVSHELPIFDCIEDSHCQTNKAVQK